MLLLRLTSLVMHLLMIASLFMHLFRLRHCVKYAMVHVQMRTNSARNVLTRYVFGNNAADARSPILSKVFILED